VEDKGDSSSSSWLIVGLCGVSIITSSMSYLKILLLFADHEFRALFGLCWLCMEMIYTPARKNYRNKAYISVSSCGSRVRVGAMTNVSNGGGGGGGGGGG
jgi:hypothetical protein